MIDEQVTDAWSCQDANFLVIGGTGGCPYDRDW